MCKIPIKKSDRYEDEYECCCKHCNHTYTYDHMHCWCWNVCDICHRKIWFNIETCTLYSRRRDIICFYCRQPYYQKGLSSGDIHRLLLPNSRKRNIQWHKIF